MPRARETNFTLKTLAKGLSPEKATHRFIALQRSGQYSELRMIQRGKLIKIVGYKWPDKTARRRAGISKNPKEGSPNKVKFGQRGKTKIGWINRGTKSRYLITYKDGPRTKNVWRKKSDVVLVNSGRKKNPGPPSQCPKYAENPAPVIQAAKLSKKFHGFPPRYKYNAKLSLPKSLMKIGECPRLEYISDKFDGKVRQYFHDFTTPVYLFANPTPQPNGDNMLLIIGKFKITEHGIV